MPEWLRTDLTCRRHVITDGHEVVSLMFHGSGLKLRVVRKKSKNSEHETRLKIVRDGGEVGRDRQTSLTSFMDPSMEWESVGRRLSPSPAYSNCETRKH